MKAGLICTVRATKGDDILAACGQLKSMEDKLNLWQDSVEG
jgi:23S rRNA (adenine2503-C2)-methyltransferase